MSTTKKATTKSVAKVETRVAPKGDQKDVFEGLMQHLEKLEKLRDVYHKLKAKRDALIVALKVMGDTMPGEHFEENTKEFPFEIVLRGPSQYNSKEEIFKITKKHTVENFTKYLHKEIEQLLEIFEADILEQSEHIKTGKP